MAVVSNSSPLILYAKVGRLHLLRDVFTDVLIPPAVREEVVSQGAGRPGAVEAADAAWIRTMPLASRATAQVFQEEIDDGEAEAIALALELAESTARRRAEIDAAFVDMGNDVVYQREAAQIMAEFAESDAEVARMLEEREGPYPYDEAERAALADPKE